MGDLFGGYNPTGTNDQTNAGGGGGITDPSAPPRPTDTGGTTTTPEPAPTPTVVVEGTVDQGAPVFEGSAGGGGAVLNEEDKDKRRRIKRRTLGTQQLQIPLTSSGVSTGATVNTGLNI